MAGDRANDELACLLAAGVPITLGEGVGDVLGEDAHDMFTGRGNGGVEGGVEVDFGPEALR